MSEPIWDQYSNYLQLDKVLQAQRLSSAVAGAPIHDEMLFIQFHQVNELWFKQILFELQAIQKKFAQNPLPESDIQPILAYLGRVVEIFKHLESMFDVLETMPSQSFLDFRQYLGTASGFQSVQFRQIEVRMGLQRTQRLCVFQGNFDQYLKDESKMLIAAEERQQSLFSLLEQWLSRTPFVHVGAYQFWGTYYQAVQHMFADKTQAIMRLFSGAAQQEQLNIIAKGKQKFEGIFDAEQHALAQKEGRWRMSWPALQAALFITLYRHELILQAPYNLLTKLMDLDEIVARWRFRHAVMVQRMVGYERGTGGSSGFEYLQNTVQAHRIFADLYSLSSYLIPSEALPSLPLEARQAMHAPGIGAPPINFL